MVLFNKTQKKNIVALISITDFSSFMYIVP